MKLNLSRLGRHHIAAPVDLVGGFWHVQHQAGAGTIGSTHFLPNRKLILPIYSGEIGYIDREYTRQVE
jgi:hypothetical protein